MIDETLNWEKIMLLFTK